MTDTPPTRFEHGLRAAFTLDAALSLAAGLLWGLCPVYFVQSAFGVAAPDRAHVALAVKGSLPLFVLGGAFYLWLVKTVSPREAVFRAWQVALTAIDLGMLGLGVQLLASSPGGDPRAAALAQVGVAALRLVLRGVYFGLTPRAGGASRSSGAR